MPPEIVVHAGLCHVTKTAIVTSTNGGQVIDDTDGLITAEVNLGLAMTAADCLLISAFDPKHRIIGLVHAGSKGLAQGVVTEFLQTWFATFPATLADLIIDISPSICPQHYTVIPEQAGHFSEWSEACVLEGDMVHLDLRHIAMAQLTASGIPKGVVTVSPRCTFEDPDFFSYRRDHPKTSQLQVGYIMRRQ